MDSKNEDQNRVVYKLLHDKILTRNQIELITGIRINVICWRIHDLREQNRIAVVKKGACPVTGEDVEFLTTDPALFPKKTQTELFS